MQKFESQVHTVARPIEEAYTKLSDLSNLSAVADRIKSIEADERLEQIPEEQREAVRKTLQSMEFTTDSVSLQSPVGAVTLRIVEREAPKLVKLQAENSPIPISLWLQLLPETDTTSRLRVTIGAEINIFMRGMLSGPLSKAAESLASVLAMV